MASLCLQDGSLRRSEGYYWQLTRSASLQRRLRIRVVQWQPIAALIYSEIPCSNKYLITGYRG